MARAYASAVIDASVETVWPIIRNFNGLPLWLPFIATSSIEEGRDAAQLGSVRAFTMTDGTLVRERLLALDDISHSLAYNFETPAFPVTDYLARIHLAPVTQTNATFIEWEATFEERPQDSGIYADRISEDVFAAGLKYLQQYLGQRGAL